MTSSTFLSKSSARCKSVGVGKRSKNALMQACFVSQEETRLINTQHTRSRHVSSIPYVEDIDDDTDMDERPTRFHPEGVECAEK
mmetsp:Transcript_502/g.1209  ORF Transcript_502/g.1209 Transcript_502/m.1209 type:complete len:84 (-) Transcript_502:30-281(-)